jgi:hypothetical protein
LRYSFNAKELNNWKGVITERLVECYIEDIIIPSLKNEWDHAFFRRDIPFLCSKENSKDSFWRNMLQRTSGQFFIGHGLYPTKELLIKIEILIKLLEHSSIPDGFLFKLKKTGETKTLKQALNEFDLGGRWGGGSVTEFRLGDYSVERHYSSDFICSEHDENEQLPIVNGEVEVIEVKSGKGEMKSYQRKDYIEMVNKGYPLRYFYVKMVSFEGNLFEIREKIFRIDGTGKLRTLKQKIPKGFSDIVF